MLQDKRQAKSHRRELQPGVPTSEQLASLFKDAMKEPGYSYELPFGTPDRFYALGVFREPSSGSCTWTMHRWENESSALLWTLATNDQRVIAQQLQTDFKNWTSSRTNMEAVAPAQPAIAPVSSKLYSQGDLRKMQFANLMRLIAADRVTGSLLLVQDDHEAEVFFIDGGPVHCVAGKATGDAALLELVGWNHGDFRFKMEPATQERTVSKHLDLILMEGTYLNDQIQDLTKQGVSDRTVLKKAKKDLSEDEFLEAAANKTGISRTLQKRFFDCIDGAQTVGEIALQCGFSRADWVPLLHNMLKAQLITSPAPKLDTIETQLSTVDWSITQPVERSLLRADTGAYGYPALMFLLEMEYNRSSRYGKPFSFLILEIGVRKEGNKLTPLPQQAARELVNLITRLKRKPDILGHYQNTGFGLLLPETDSLLAKRFASRLQEVLLSGPQLSSVAFSVGVAGCPHDAQDLPALIAACVENRQKFGF